MRKVVLLFLILLTLTGCKQVDDKGNNWAVLPDLNGYEREEIDARLTGLGITFIIEELNTTSTSTTSNQFYAYDNQDVGDIINLDEPIIVFVYPVYVGDMIILPDLKGLTRQEIVSSLLTLGLSHYFIEIDTENASLYDTFHSYDDFYFTGDYFSPGSAIGINIYVEQNNQSGVFQVLDLVYDGPHLDESYEDINYLNPRGGYFEVTLRGCTDGDTGKFNYPSDVYEAIQSSAKSSRFLNMDTEETYWGGEEEWGKPASVYTCSLLTSATSIILQTDPNDGLLGTYGRLLSWVWIKLPGEEEYFLLNYMVVKQGLAQVKFEFGAGETLEYGERTYNEWMHVAEDYAKSNDYGQWGNLLDYYWNYDSDEPYYDRWN